MADQYATQRPKRHGSPIFYSLLDEMAETHDKKSHDYATDNDPYGNYKFAGIYATLFAHSPDDAGFAGRIAEKIYRLSVLGKRQAQPFNESIDDTERDIAVIATLWMASRREKRYGGAAGPGKPVAGCYQETASDSVKEALLEVAQLAGELTLRDKIKLVDSLLSNIITAAESHEQNRRCAKTSPLSNSTGE